MSQVQAQIDIDASTSKVWETLVDSASLAEWLPNSINLDSFQRLSGNGSSPRYYHYDLLSSVRERAISWEAYRSYSYVVENIGPIKSAHISFYLESSPEGAKLTQSVDLRMKFGPLGAIMGRLVFRPQFRKQMEASLASLKRYAEDQQQWESGAGNPHALAA